MYTSSSLIVAAQPLVLHKCGIMRVARMHARLLTWTLGVFILITSAKGMKGDGDDDNADTCPTVSGTTSCLQPRDIPLHRPVPSNDLGMGSDVMRFSSGSQVIVASYTFTCCGRVKLWSTYVDPGGMEDGEYDITFQVWRSSSNIGSNGCYSLVGSNIFSQIDLGSGGLVCGVPGSVQDEILVQQGDVVGFFGEHQEGGTRGVQISQDYTNETVWYAENPQLSGNLQCPYPVGEGRVLTMSTNYAPILSVTVEMEDCSQLQTTTIPTSTNPLPTTHQATREYTPQLCSDDRTGVAEGCIKTNNLTSIDITTSGLSSGDIFGFFILAVVVVLVVAAISTVSIYCLVRTRRVHKQKLPPVRQSELTYNRVYCGNNAADSASLPQAVAESSNASSCYYIQPNAPTNPMPSLSRTHGAIDTTAVLNAGSDSHTILPYIVMQGSFNTTQDADANVYCPVNGGDSKEASTDSATPVTNHTAAQKVLHRSPNGDSSTCLVNDDTKETDDTEFDIVQNKAYTGHKV